MDGWIYRDLSLHTNWCRFYTVGHLQVPQCQRRCPPVPFPHNMCGVWASPKHLALASQRRPTAAAALHSQSVNHCDSITDGAHCSFPPMHA
jgi:hypothetical protein